MKVLIGLVMGIVGIEVVKESFDIIILDDNFVFIVKVCEYCVFRFLDVCLLEDWIVFCLGFRCVI